MSGYSAELLQHIIPFFTRFPSANEVLAELPVIACAGPLTQRDALWLRWERARAWLHLRFLRRRTAHSPEMMKALSMGALLAVQPDLRDTIDDTEETWKTLVDDGEVWVRECDSFRNRALDVEPWKSEREREIDLERRTIAASVSESQAELYVRIRERKRRLFLHLEMSPDLGDDAIKADLAAIVRDLRGRHDDLLYVAADGKAKIHRHKILDGLRDIHGREPHLDSPAEAEDIGSDALHQLTAPSTSEPSLDVVQRDFADAYEALVVRTERDARSPHERLVVEVLRRPELLDGTVSVATAARELRCSESALRRAIGKARELQDVWLARQEDPQPRRKIRD